MKVLTKEQEAAHYREVLKGGGIGGIVGLSLGLLGTVAATRRYPAFRSLTLPFKTFLVTSSGTFGLIINADRWSMAYQKAQNPMNAYRDMSSRSHEQALRHATVGDRFMEWGRQHRYSIVFASWLATMGGSLAIVGKSKYLTTAQKVVQARVYAQGLTLVVLLITAAFETYDAKHGSGRWETIMVVDPDDPKHEHLIEKKVHREEYEGQDLWKDMVAAEEQRIADRKKQKEEEAAAAKKKEVPAS